METMSIPVLIADLRCLGLSPKPFPIHPMGTRPPSEILDRWTWAATLGEPQVREAAIWAIREAARANGLIPASIQALYAARGQGEWGGRTVPAMNLRGWTYQPCRDTLY